VRDYVQTRPLRRIIVVTTAYHTARARLAFRKVMHGTGVDVCMAASEDPWATETNWYTSCRGITKYLWESAANPYYWIAY